jgi:hypothetical protein
MVNLFGTYNEEERILKDLKTTMDNFQKKVDRCTSKLPNRQNMEFLEGFAIKELGVVENNIASMMDKIDLFESSLRRDDESIEDVQKIINHVCDLCKLVGAFKMKTKKRHLRK